LGLIIKSPFLLHVGGNQWYKNREGVLRIFAHFIKDPNYKHYYLVMAGYPFTAKMKKIIADLNIGQQVLELVRINSKNLCALYSTAKALIFPSLHEGFGWPIIEAQACKCPVFTSNRVPMNEVGGNAAIYLNPDDEYDAALIIAEKLKDRDSIIAAGLINVSRFSTKTMIDKYISVYQTAMHSKIK
jgi:glycosyltransferase involved in cell wall biosynthesis